MVCEQSIKLNTQKIVYLACRQVETINGYQPHFQTVEQNASTFPRTPNLNSSLVTLLIICDFLDYS